MKVRQLTTSIALAAVFAAGSAFAQTSAPSTSPSNTPNDTTATPPNTAVPAGAPTAAPQQERSSATSTTPVMPTTKEPRGNAPSDVGNTNVAPTQGGAAPYTGQKPQQ